MGSVKISSYFVIFVNKVLDRSLLPSPARPEALDGHTTSPAQVLGCAGKERHRWRPVDCFGRRVSVGER